MLGMPRLAGGEASMDDGRWMPGRRHVPLSRPSSISINHQGVLRPVSANTDPWRILPGIAILYCASTPTGLPPPPPPAFFPIARGKGEKDRCPISEKTPSSK